jgi:hypothetical protein
MRRAREEGLTADRRLLGWAGQQGCEQLRLQQQLVVRHAAKSEIELIN